MKELVFVLSRVKSARRSSTRSTLVVISFLSVRFSNSVRGAELLEGDNQISKDDGGDQDRVFLIARLMRFFLFVTLMLMFAPGRQSCVNPVLLTTSVVPHVRVTKRRQFTGSVLRSISSRLGAVDDDVSRLIGQKSWSKLRYLVWR